jgi:hypothetical protein
MSCHVGIASTFVEEISSWQFSWATMTTEPTTGPDTEGQSRFALIVAGPLRLHVPGPTRGTTATAKPGVRVPASAPLAALTLGARAGDLTFEAVTTPDRRATVTLVGEVVVGEGSVVDVVDFGVEVVTEATVVETRDGSGGGVPRADTVNNRTRSKSGLDHTRTCPPGRKWGVLAIRVRP